MYRWALPGEDETAFAARLAQELEDTIVREGPDTVAAVIAEPLMGAGGVMPPPRGYFELVRAITRKHSVLLVSDEVVCGFGRLGHHLLLTQYLIY
jgi:4-aminobutyrate--pyruvate transaminase